MARTKHGTQKKPQVKSEKALLLWSRENKTGVESISHIPENSRFPGAVTPVLFKGDKKYYPAKIIMISDDDAALEKKSAEIEAEIERAKELLGVEGSNQPAKRASRKVVKPGAATVRAIDVATGSRPSVPKELEAAHKGDQKARKSDKQSHIQAQLSVDRQVLSSVKKHLFSTNQDEKEAEKPQSELELNDDEDMSDFDSDEENAGSGVQNDDESESKAEGKWCECKSCQVLQKYDSPLFHNFLKDLHEMFSVEGNGDCKQILYLELLPIPPNVKQLSPSSNIYIAASDKDELKVDYRNKPSTLAKETLFRLYGREAFQTLSVTGMGIKGGTYTIPGNVKKAIVAFINRNVDSEKRMSMKKFTALIKKRAPEWRKTQTPKQKKAMSKAKKSPREKSTQIISTSPFKVASTEENNSRGSNTPLKSPRPSPFKSPLKSPKTSLLSRPSPLKSPRKSLQMSQFNQEPPSFESATAALQSQPHSGHGGEANGAASAFATSSTPFSSGQGWDSSHSKVGGPGPYGGHPQQWGEAMSWESSSNASAYSHGPYAHGPYAHGPGGPSYTSLWRQGY